MEKFNKFLLVCCYGLGTVGIQLGSQMKCEDYIDNNYDDDSKTERFCHCDSYGSNVLCLK